MTHLRSLTRGISPWAPAGRSGADLRWPAPIGGRLLWLVLILVLALAVHGRHRPMRLPPAQVHQDVVGVARIIDGDTIDVARVRIRLAGIDAPESDQTCTDADNRTWRCGRAATRVLIEHLGGRPLSCRTSGLDRYRRSLAVCSLPDGSDINAWMVQQGWALAYTAYSDAYRTQEGEAQAGKRGIWAGTFIPPWEWRHQHRHWWQG